MTRGAAVEWTMLPGKNQKTYRETCPSTTVSTTGTKQNNMSTNPADWQLTAWAEHSHHVQYRTNRLQDMWQFQKLDAL
jgi:hypothetical protein